MQYNLYCSALLLLNR